MNKDLMSDREYLEVDELKPVKKIINDSAYGCIGGIHLYGCDKLLKGYINSLYGVNKKGVREYYKTLNKNDKIYLESLQHQIAIENNEYITICLRNLSKVKYGGQREMLQSAINKIKGV